MISFLLFPPISFESILVCDLLQYTPFCCFLLWFGDQMLYYVGKIYGDMYEFVYTSCYDSDIYVYIEYEG